MWTQIVGKVRLALAPHINHWWQVPLYVNSRGLTTSAIPYAGRTFEVQFDFIEHRLLITVCDGDITSLPLHPQTVAAFYAQFMTALRALGIEVRIWYVGLDSVERHLARVRSRVAQGGHDIPSERIQERYVQSRLNLIRLLPRLTELLLFDNSVEADLRAGTALEPKLLLHIVRGKIRDICKLNDVPEWAKPILATALKLRPDGPA